MVKSKIELAIDLGRSMAELRNGLRQYIQVKLKAHGINMTFEMLEVMSVLWKNDGINQQELADQTLKDKSSMTYLIDNLVKRKLVQRVEDDNDRRNKLIYLTEEAKVLQKEICPWVSEVYGIATVDLNAADLQDSLSVFNKMIENLKKD